MHGGPNERHGTGTALEPEADQRDGVWMGRLARGSCAGAGLGQFYVEIDFANPNLRSVMLCFESQERSQIGEGDNAYCPE